MFKKSGNKTIKPKGMVKIMATNKITQVKALETVIDAIKDTDIVSAEVINKIVDIKTALEKKANATSKRASNANAELLEKVLPLFTDASNTLTELLTANREQFDELGILTSQKLNAVIRPAVEDGRLFREKNGKTTTFRIVK